MKEKSVVISLCDLTGNMVLPWAQAGYRCICIDTQHPEGITDHPLHRNIKRWGIDILDSRVETFVLLHNKMTAFISCFPPCTDLTGAGSRWWKSKGDEAYEFAMKLVRRCEELGELSNAPYFIENPPGRIASGAGCTVEKHPSRWRKWDYRFQPYEYGGYYEYGKALWNTYDMQSIIDKFKSFDDGSGGEIPTWHRFTSYCRDHCGVITSKGTDDDGYHKSTCLWTGGGFTMPEKKPVPFNDKPNFIHMCPPGEERANVRSVTPKGFAVAVYEANRPDRNGDKN